MSLLKRLCYVECSLGITIELHLSLNTPVLPALCKFVHAVCPCGIGKNNDREVIKFELELVLNIMLSFITLNIWSSPTKLVVTETCVLTFV